MIKVVLADSQLTIREAMASNIDMEPDMEVAGMAKDGLEAINMCLQLKPTIILLSVQLLVIDGFAALKGIKQTMPDIPVLLLTTFIDKEEMIQAIKSGATAYLLKEIETASLVSSIRNCVAGQLIFPSSLQSFLIEQATKRYCANQEVESSINQLLAKHKIHLTSREYELLNLLLIGSNNEAISKELYLSVGTVKNNLSKLYKKFAVSSRADLLSFVYSLLKKEGLLI